MLVKFLKMKGPLRLMILMVLGALAAASCGQGVALAQDGEASSGAESLPAMMKDMAAELGRDEQKHFFALYQMYNADSMVKSVKADIADASAQCADKHSDLSAKISSRFEAWDKAIAARIEKVDQQVGNMIIAQDYMEEAKLRGFLDKIDALRAEQSKGPQGQERSVVTTLEACEGLYQSMDGTQAQFSQLLDEALALLPQAQKQEEAPAEGPQEES